MIGSGIYRHQVKRETEKAVAVEIDRTGGVTVFNRERVSLVWFPKSKIEWRETVYGDELVAPAWLLRKVL